MGLTDTGRGPGPGAPQGPQCHLPSPCPLQVGATFPAVIPCHTCTCLSVGTHDPIVQCEEDACDTTCPQVRPASWADPGPWGSPQPPHPRVQEGSPAQAKQEDGGRGLGRRAGPAGLGSGSWRAQVQKVLEAGVRLRGDTGAGQGHCLTEERRC